MGVKYRQFDIFNYRGAALRDKLESFLKEGNISAIIYSNPNNPAWICLEEEELQIIGELATQYDTIVLEDLAYFAMDFRRDLSRPFEPPFQATVARYTDNYMLMLSASKIFSYAGQRMAGDGFFFTIGYPGMTSGELMRELLYYGISSITLNTTGSLQEGIRACTSRMTDELFDILEQRLKAFKTDHPL